ncbi:MAG: gluconate 2-dehydrogenase subunit 3 family protein [Terriglobales bacterium]
MNPTSDPSMAAGSAAELAAPAGGLPRRDVLKVLGAAPAAALIAGAIPAHAAVAGASGSEPRTAAGTAAAAAYEPRALTAREYRLLTVLADLILPADERSGSATAAGVPECVDDFLTIRGARLRDQIRGGFLWLNITANQAYGHDFADCAQAQQTALLDRIAWPDRATIPDANGAAFFSDLRNLVVNAFYSSKMGVADLQYEGNHPVQWHGCPPNVLAQLDVSYPASFAYDRELREKNAARTED